MGEAVLLYDADCGFCRVMLALLLLWDRGRRLRPLELQGSEANALTNGMSDEERMGSWHLVTGDGRLLSAGKAFPPFFGLLPGGAPLAWLTARFPGPSESVYRWIAGHRSDFGPLLPGRAKRWADGVLADRSADAASRETRTGAASASRG